MGEIEKLEEDWKRRASAQGYAPRSAKYRSALIEFLLGAFSFASAAGHPSAERLGIMAFMAAVDRDPFPTKEES